MRIIGEIPHPRLKITVFQMDQRLSLKLENGSLEQTYKFRRGEAIENFEDVKRFCTDKFVASVELIFKKMEDVQKQHGSAIRADENEFDEII